MFMVNQLVGFGSFIDSAVLTFTPTTSPAPSTANGTGYTFSTADIGEAHDDRVFIFCAVGESGFSPSMTCTATVGGSAATLQGTIANHNNGVDCHITAVFAIALNAAVGTTADIVVTFNASSRNCCVAGGWTRHGSITASQTYQDSDDPHDFTIDVAAGGFAVLFGGCDGGGSSTTGVTITGLANEAVDKAVEGAALIYQGYENFASAQSSLAVQSDLAGTDFLSSGAVVVYNPL